MPRALTNARHFAQELRELGLQRSLFRIGWELKTRTGLQGRFARPPSDEIPMRLLRLPFARPEAVTAAVSLEPAKLDALVRLATDASHGRLQCFGRWRADYGNPPDWHLNPVSGRRWNSDAFWSRALEQQDVGDIKLTWEIGRFPQAYWMARAAAWRPELANDLSSEIASQIDAFLESNPWPRGVHWASGQEVAFRMMAWLFAVDVLSLPKETVDKVARALRLAAFHVEQHIDYARFAVYNNHVLSESLLLYAAGTLLPDAPEAARWRRFGKEVFDHAVDQQFYRDGGYIQQSHTYQRLALQLLAWACLVARAGNEKPSESWLAAMGRSVDFLHAHQNPRDGTLPNYGANDGAQPSILTTCDYTDFRPILQTASILARGERLYPPGPWDEEAAWMIGPSALASPLRAKAQTSASFPFSGHHVLRGKRDDTFAAFRCGTLRDRFSQIDMLHLDVTWRGHNVLVDGGSYLYNGQRHWHDHFVGTASHNTLTVDGLDQMLHHRRFKVLYLTKAKLLQFADSAERAVVTGEHYGYNRHPGQVTHRRSVLHFKDDVWVVVDTLTGEPRTEHAFRLHWLAGDFPFTADENEGRLSLDTPEGAFHIRTYDVDARPLPATVVAGQDTPPRGWLSRYYGEKTPVPSLAVETRSALPVSFITVLAGTEARLERRGNDYVVLTPAAEHRFTIRERAAEVLENDS